MRRTVLLASLVFAFVLAAAVPAFAAAPATDPMVVGAWNFDTAKPANVSLNWDDKGFNAWARAYWGPRASVGYGSTAGLWVAGSTVPGKTPAVWPTYPVETAGSMAVDLRQSALGAGSLASFYSSQVRFKYNMSSIREFDDHALQLGWDTTRGNQLLYSTGVFPLTTTTAWSTKSFDMAIPGSTNASRADGVVTLFWSGGSNGAAQRGPIIDDFAVTGYKYGPVRNLATAADAGGVKVSWNRPYRSTAENTVEERPIVYRVWRVDGGQTAYNEITPAGGMTDTGEALSIVDNVDKAKGYTYYVQAWDPNDGAGYGQLLSRNFGNPTPPPPPTPPVAGEAQRLYGADRVLTSIAIANNAFPSALGAGQAVILAPGNRWQEALIGSSLSGAVNGPIILCATKAPWQTNVLAELNKLKPAKIYLVGSTANLPTTVDDFLSANGYSGKFERLGGTAADPSGYAASLAVAQKVAAIRGTGGSMFLATADKPWDALSAASLASRLKAPIVLTPAPAAGVGDGVALPSASSQALTAVKPATVIAVGGAGVVSDARLNDAKSAAGASATDRLSGADRFATSADIARYGVGLFPGPTDAYLATGRNYPDALAGGVVAGIGPTGRWQPLLLTESAGIPSTVATFITGQKSTLRTGHMLGGPTVISVGAAFVAAAK